MKKNIFASFALMFLFIALSSCKDTIHRGSDNYTPPDITDPTPVIDTNQDFLLYLDYWNPDGNSPRVELDTLRTSDGIILDPATQWTYHLHGNDSSCVILENISLADNNGNYEIMMANSEEFTDNQWHSTTEFSLEYDRVDHLNVVLVLDVSASLNNDFENVKTLAKNFITSVKSFSPLARIGVVAFATSVDSLGLSADTSTVFQYIDQLVPGQFTALYDGINAGIHMLSHTTANARAMVTFTDGNDNNSTQALSPETLVSMLKTSGPNSSRIKSYIIGLHGDDGIDESILRSLTASNGLYAFPLSIDELQTVFNRFSRAVTNNYNLRYIRNRQIVSPDNKRPIRLRINGELL